MPPGDSNPSRRISSQFVSSSVFAFGSSTATSGALSISVLGFLLGALFLSSSSSSMLEERIREQLLLQVLLQVEQRHVQHVHRLVQARIDLELLPKTQALVQPSLHPVGPGGDSVGSTAAAARASASPCSALKRVRSRAVSVGPR